MGIKYFDVRDICRAPRLALSGKKIVIHLVGAVAGWIGYLILSYLAYLTEGATLSMIWDQFGLFPAPAVGGHWYSLVIGYVGLYWLIMSYMLAATAVGKITFEQLRGDDFYSIRDALGFLKKYYLTVVLSPTTLVVFVILLVFGGFVLSLFTKIPYVGELGFMLVFGLPTLVIAFFTAYILIVLIASFLISPAVVATTREDSFETIIQSFSTIWNQPWRWAAYTWITLGLARVGAAVFGWFLTTGMGLIAFAFSFVTGEKYQTLLGYSAKYWAPLGGTINNLIGQADGLMPEQLMQNVPAAVTIPQGFPIDENVVTGDIASFVIGITLAVGALFVFGYFLSVISSGQTLIYVVLRKKKDGENLLEREEEEEELSLPPLEEKKEEPKPEEKPPEGEKKK